MQLEGGFQRPLCTENDLGHSIFENILVAVDGSKHSDVAFGVAIDIAQKYGSQLFVLHVFQDGTGSITMFPLGFEDDLRSVGHRILNSYEAKVKEARL